MNCEEESLGKKRCRICFMSNESLTSLSVHNSGRNCFPCQRPSKVAEDDDFLTNVCACRGSIGSVHKTCLQKWLSISNSTSCDLCHTSFRHLLVHKPKTFGDFLASTSSSMSWKSYFWVDVLSFVLLTPVTSVSLSLCLKGLLYYAKTIAEYISLIVLMALLVTTYTMWLITCSYQHVRSFREWKRLNFDLVVDQRLRSPELVIPSISGHLSNVPRRGNFTRTSTVNRDVSMMMRPADNPFSPSRSSLFMLGPPPLYMEHL